MFDICLLVNSTEMNIDFLAPKKEKNPKCFETFQSLGINSRELAMLSLVLQ